MQVPSGMPLDLEIGCGAGWHPIRYAQKNPERFLVAVEHTHNRFASFERRLSRHPSVTNLKAVHANAVAWVTHALERESVDRVFFLYPNPYPKSSDLNKRWYGMPFMQRVIDVLKPGGEIVFSTNEAFYSSEAKQFMTRQWGLKQVENLEFSKETAPAGYPRTHFEKKYLERGERCFQLRFAKN
jgi:tRNA G46 methylase TrmB